MTLYTQLLELINASYSGIWLKTHEQHEAALTVVRLCEENANMRLMRWDAEFGTLLPEDNEPLEATTTELAPLKALVALRKLPPVENNVHSILLMHNAGKVLTNSMGWTQAAVRTAVLGRSRNWHVIMLVPPTVPMPAELAAVYHVVHHKLPDVKLRESIVVDLMEQPGLLVPASESKAVEDVAAAIAAGRAAATILVTSEAGRRVVTGLSGLTGMQIEEALSLVNVRSAARNPTGTFPGEYAFTNAGMVELQDMKSSMISQGGTLEMFKPVYGFDKLGGLNNLKNSMLRTLRSPRRSAEVRPKGVMILGVPGVGKSAIVKALGYEMQMQVVRLNVGALMGSLVGQTEERTRQTLEQLDTMAPVIVLADEIEKMLAGAGGGSRDSGVSDRLFGTLLTWMNDHESDVYMVATCNDIRRLAEASSGAFTRAGRFDGVFFVDLPDREQKDEIWRIWIKHFMMHGLTAEDSAKIPADKDWTGAEIQDCCLKATLQTISLVAAAKQVVPVAVTSGEQITELKEWAHNRCLSADWDGLYDKNGKPSSTDAATTKPRRRVAVSA